MWCVILTVLGVFEDRFCIRWWRRCWRRMVVCLRRLVFGVVMRRRYMRTDVIHGQKAIFRQPSDVKRHHISTLFSQRSVSVKVASKHVVAILREHWPWRVRLPFVVWLSR